MSSVNADHNWAVSIFVKLPTKIKAGSYAILTEHPISGALLRTRSNVISGVGSRWYGSYKLNTKFVSTNKARNKTKIRVKMFSKSYCWLLHMSTSKERRNANPPMPNNFSLYSLRLTPSNHYSCSNVPSEPLSEILHTLCSFVIKITWPHHPTSQHFFLHPHLILNFPHYSYTITAYSHSSWTFVPAFPKAWHSFSEFLHSSSCTLTIVTCRFFIFLHHNSNVQRCAHRNAAQISRFTKSLCFRNYLQRGWDRCQLHSSEPCSINSDDLHIKWEVPGICTGCPTWAKMSSQQMAIEHWTQQLW